VEQIYTVKKYKNSNESVLCIQVKNQLCYTFFRFNHPKTEIQKKIINLCENCANNSSNEASNREEVKIKSFKNKEVKEKDTRKESKSDEEKKTTNKTVKDEKINNFFKDSKKSLNKLKNKIIQNPNENKLPSKIEEDNNGSDETSSIKIQPVYRKKSFGLRHKCYSENEIENFYINSPSLETSRQYKSEFIANQDNEYEVSDSVWNLNMSHSTVNHDEEKVKKEDTVKEANKCVSFQDYVQSKSKTDKKHRNQKNVTKENILKEQNAPIKGTRMEVLTLDKQITILMGLLITFLVSSLFFYFRLDSLENQLLFHSSKLTHSFVTI
jgi:hypothetical protein